MIDFIAAGHSSASVARMGRYRWSGLFALVAVVVLGVVEAASAMPSAALPAVEWSLPIVRVLTTCDARGCFTFGPRQRYTRPDIMPSDQTGPNYYRPDAAGPPHYIQRPPPALKRQPLRLPVERPNAHRRGCSDRYLSYDPRTDRYRGPGGRQIRCPLP